MIFGTSDGREHRLKGGRSIDQEGHLVPGDQRAPTDHFNEESISLENIRWFNLPFQPFHHGVAYLRRELSFGAEDLRGGVCP